MITNKLKYWDIKARVLNNNVYMEYTNKLTGNTDTVVKRLQQVALDNMPYNETT